MNLKLKSLLLSLLLLLTALPVQAEEGKWIDGIKFRAALNMHSTTFSLPWYGAGALDKNIIHDPGGEEWMMPIVLNFPRNPDELMVLPWCCV